MPNIKIRGQTVDVDIESELREFDWGYRARWTPDKLIAASPFRYDQTPSFFCNLDGPYAGTWKDSGAYDVEGESGGFVKLLAFLRNESYEETEDYLLAAYGYRPDGTLKMPKLNLRLPKPFRALPETTIDQAVSPYLSRRGISAEVQCMVGVGKGAYRGFTAIPWRMPDGRLANVKYRATRGKAFFYHRGGYPIRHLVWGSDIVYSQRVRIAVLCEAEIDAMSWWTVGQPAVAIGGVAFTEEQADILRRSPLEEIWLGGDNDKAGQKFNEQAERMLHGYVRLRAIEWPDGVKDANESLAKNGCIYHISKTLQACYNMVAVPHGRNLGAGKSR